MQKTSYTKTEQEDKIKKQSNIVQIKDEIEKEDSIKSVSESEDEKKDEDFVSPYEILDINGYQSTALNEIKEVVAIEPKLEEKNYVTSPHLSRNNSKEGISLVAQKMTLLSPIVKSRESQKPFEFNPKSKEKLIKSARKRSKAPSKKEGMKLIKSLQKLEITGWEDKEDLQYFYDKMMSSSKKSKKKKIIINKGLKKSKKIK